MNHPSRPAATLLVGAIIMRHDSDASELESLTRIVTRMICQPEPRLELEVVEFISAPPATD
jgi:uncharacterized membrane protein YqjE